jgi:hypothetical protein
VLSAAAATGAAGRSSTRPRRDRADAFVHVATRSYALDLDCPAPPRGDDWVARAVDAGVLAPVAWAVRRGGHPLPAPLARLHFDVAARHLRTMADLREVTIALDAVDVAHAVLKGPVLSGEVFRERVRDYTDLDVLVDPTRLGRAVDAMVGMGARVTPTDWQHVTRARTAEIALELRHGTLLDLHCSVVNRGVVRDGYAIATAELLDRRVVRQVDGVPFPSLDDLDFTLHVLLHACLSGCHQLRWLLDAHQCTRWLRLPPAALADRAAGRGVSLAARAVLDSVAQHLDPSVTAWAEEFGHVTLWNRALTVLSRRRPPSSPSLSTRSTRTWFGATRSTQRASWSSAARAAGLALRNRGRAWPEPCPVQVSTADQGYRRWLAEAERIAPGRQGTAS